MLTLSLKLVYVSVCVNVPLCMS